MFEFFRRIIKTGLKNFARQSGFSLSTIFILVITIFLISFLFIFHQTTQVLVLDIQERADISAYFQPEASEEEILEAKEEIAKVPGVKSVEYISSAEALKDFRERYKSNPMIMEGLEEVGMNPLLAALNIQAEGLAQYDAISDFLKNSSFKNLIHHDTYYPQKRSIIEKLYSVTTKVNQAGIVLSMVLILVAVAIVFNTIKIAIYNAQEEISVMKLVGASNWFIRGPFIIQGIMCGILATIIAFFSFVIVCYFMGPKLDALLLGFNIYSFIANNLLVIFAIQLACATAIGVVSSMIAIRRYLKV